MTFEQQKSIIADVLATTPPPYPSVRYRLIPDNEDAGGQAWLLVLYLNNFADHLQSQQTSIVEWCHVLLTKINNLGVPCGITRIKENNEV